jgi:hypothetical protein
MCPNCDGLAVHRIDTLFSKAGVLYRCCEDCGHLWTIDDHTGIVVQHLTPLRGLLHRAPEAEDLAKLPS